MFESTFFTFHSEPKSIIMKFVHSNLNPNHIIPNSLLKNDRNMILRIPLIETHIPNRTSSISHESEYCFSYLRQSQIEYCPYLTNPNTALQGFNSWIESHWRFDFQTIRIPLQYIWHYFTVSLLFRFSIYIQILKIKLINYIGLVPNLNKKAAEVDVGY